MSCPLPTFLHTGLVLNVRWVQAGRMVFETPSESSSMRWASHEFATLNCGDVRRHRRFVRVASDFIQHPGASIPDASAGWAGSKACYRLFDHKDIRCEAVLAAHRDAVLGRLVAEQTESALLVVQDTTSLNFGPRSCVEGFGPIGNGSVSNAPGLYVHGQLVVGGDGRVHGLAGAAIYARTEQRKGQSAGTRNRQPIEEKESMRWLKGWQEAQRLWKDLGGKRQVLSVADREGDIYELLAACLTERKLDGASAGLLIRSQHDRELESGGGRMWQDDEALTLRATLEVDLPRGKQGLKARKATLSVRAGRVRLAVPAHKRKYLGLEESLELWALEVKEINPPEGVEAVCWRLVTTEPIDGVEDARRLTAWYALRWRIELLHRVLKSGCKVENRQIHDVEKLKAFIALDLVIASHLLSLAWQARVSPESSSEPWLERPEWEALCVHAAKGGPPPSIAPTIGKAVIMIARLGGFLARKGDGDPGAEVLWRGLSKLRMLTQAWLIFRSGNCG